MIFVVLFFYVSRSVLRVEHWQCDISISINVNIAVCRHLNVKTKCSKQLLVIASISVFIKKYKRRQQPVYSLLCHTCQVDNRMSMHDAVIESTRVVLVSCVENAQYPSERKNSHFFFLNLLNIGFQRFQIHI